MANLSKLNSSKNYSELCYTLYFQKYTFTSVIGKTIEFEINNFIEFAGKLSGLNLPMYV